MEYARHLGNHDAEADGKQASTLHQEGKHADSVAKYEEAAKTVGVTLDRKK